MSNRRFAPLAILIAAVVLVSGTAGGAAQANLADATVALYDGNCNERAVEPVFELGMLELDAQYASASAFAEDFDPGEIGSGDVEAEGVIDAAGNGYLYEDLNDNGRLDDGEDLNNNGVLDVGIDDDGDGTLDGNEIIAVSDPDLPSSALTTVWKVDGEIDATFDDLFGAPGDDDAPFTDTGAIVVHAGSSGSGEMLACAEVATSAGWEDRDTVVVGVTPEGGSDVFGYAVFERDTGNVPVFGDNTTGVTVYMIDNLPTLRDSGQEATPQS